jgi:hypothetical protein
MRTIVPSGIRGRARIRYPEWLADEHGRRDRTFVAGLDRWPGHIWAENWGEGAIYSPDGSTIQFDHGQVWQRAIELPPPEPEAVVVRKRRVR